MQKKSARTKADAAAQAAKACHGDGLEQRIAAMEAKWRLLEATNVGYEMKMADIHAKQRDIERRQEAERAAAYEAAKPRREGLFRKFAAERLTLASNAMTAGWAVAAAYKAFIADQQAPKSVRMSDEEFFAAIATLNEVEPTVVRAGPNAGRQQGFAGVEVKSEFRHPHDAAGREDRGVDPRSVADREAEHRDRLAFENAIHPARRAPAARS